MQGKPKVIQMSASVLDRARVASAPAELVGLVPVRIHPDVRRATAGLRLNLELLDDVGLVVARIGICCPEIVLVDADMLDCPEGLCRLARSLRPDVRCVALSCFWSEREETLRACADAVVHKPIRDGEWRDLFGCLGAIDATIPAPLGHTPHLAA
jgi:hypothetical protein